MLQTLISEKIMGKDILLFIFLGNFFFQSGKSGQIVGFIAKMLGYRSSSQAKKRDIIEFFQKHTF